MILLILVDRNLITWNLMQPETQCNLQQLFFCDFLIFEMEKNRDRTL